MDSLYSRLYKRLESHSKSGDRESDSRYHKYEYRSFGLKTPVFRELLKEFRPEVKALDLKNAREFTLECFQSGVEELIQAGIWAFAYHTKGLSPKDFPFLRKLAKLLNSWSTVDSFAPAIVQPLLVKYPEETADLLREWSRSKLLWERRLSVVVFTRKIGSSGNYTDLGLELCEANINDKEDLMRKGIGWALKDLMEGDHKRVLNYVKGLRKRKVSSTITLYAIERLDPAERNLILKL